MLNWLRKFQIGFYHAAYHRNMKRADLARTNKDVLAFKKYIYQAEDAWRKIVLITNKIKTDG